MSTQAECVTVLQTEFERLKQYLVALPADAWTTRSACALWEVRDVVAHLIFEANYYTDCITRGLQEDTSTPEGRPEPGSFDTTSQEERQQMAAVAAQRMIAVRESLGQELLDVFCQTGDHFNHLVARLSPHEWETPCYDPRGLLPVSALVNEGVFELASIAGISALYASRPRIFRRKPSPSCLTSSQSACIGAFYPTLSSPPQSGIVLRSQARATVRGILWWKATQPTWHLPPMPPPPTRRFLARERPSRC